jgi:hypothetical protein
MWRAMIDGGCGCARQSDVVSACREARVKSRRARNRSEAVAIEVEPNPGFGLRVQS